MYNAFRISKLKSSYEKQLHRLHKKIKVVQRSNKKYYKNLEND